MKGAAAHKHAPAPSDAEVRALELEDLVLHPGALGRLRRELIWTMGERNAAGVLARFGFSCGQLDLQRGASLFTLRGLGKMRQPKNQGADQDQIFDVNDSREAAEHVTYFGASTTPQCWLLAGYLTGLLSDHQHQPVYVLEVQCVAKKDSRCRFVGRPRSDWHNDPGADLTIYDEQNLAFELATTREQLTLTRERYQNLFEQSSLPILITDPDTGAYLNANVAAEELTGYTREELLKMKIFDLRHPEEHHQAIAQMKALVAKGRVTDEEIRIVRKDGSIRAIARSSKILPYGGRRVVQTIMRDITDLKVSNQKEQDLHRQLLRSERLSSIGRLAAGVAHELKNPLGAIRNAVYYVRSALANNPVLETDPHLKEVLRLAESEVDAAVNIIGELLDFSRVVQLVPRRTQINDLLEKLPSLVEIPDNVKIVWDLDLTLPSARVDPERLSQVFTNMASNAVQAMPQGGTLRIRTRMVIETSGEEQVSGEGRVSSERIVVTFEDTGTGIEPLHLTKIFEPLFTTKARGTGLGLTISSNIVEKHGGAILVTSQTGKGTSFNIKLPLQPPQDKEEKA